MAKNQQRLPDTIPVKPKATGDLSELTTKQPLPLTSKQPLVSVCIPSYNCSEFISQAIESVFDQDYTNIELVITDDASTDNSVDVIKQVLAQKPVDFPITFKTLPENTGIAGNWNYCLGLAQGTYIKILPADDYITPDCVARQVEVFEQHQHEIALVFSSRDVITRSGKKVLTANFFQDGLVNNTSLIKKCVIGGTNVIGEPAAVLFRRAEADQVGQFSEQRPYTIDIDYWSRLLSQGHAYAISQPLCVFRIDNNLSVRLGKQRVTHYWHLIRELEQNWGLSKSLVYAGYTRTLINELLRRVVHFYCRVRG